jgi:hypothetical protein
MCLLLLLLLLCAGQVVLPLQSACDRTVIENIAISLLEKLALRLEVSVDMHMSYAHVLSRVGATRSIRIDHVRV